MLGWTQGAQDSTDPESASAESPLAKPKGMPPSVVESLWKGFIDSISSCSLIQSSES